MKYILSLSFIATLLAGSSGFADIPPRPSPESLCQGHSEGQKCGNPLSGYGTCLPVRGTLICIAVDDTAKAKAADTADKPAIHASESAKEEAPQALGCTNLNMLPSSLLSIVSLVMGLYIVMRNRKKI